MSDEVLSTISEIPNLPENHLPRTNYVTWLHSTLRSGKRVVVVKGPEGKGKSTLLNEYIRSFPNQCISYFIGADYWSSSPHSFLLEMCDQLIALQQERIQPIDFNMSDNELESMFNTLYRRLAKRCHKEKLEFFFVIDGIDHVSKIAGDKTIIDLLPSDPPEGFYLLISSSNELEIPFNHETFQIPNFSLPETNHYLQDFGIPAEKIKEIYNSCDGMPGYLAELRMELKSGQSVDIVLQNLPNGFKNLLDRNWNRLVKDDLLLNIMSIVCNSLTPLNSEQIAVIIEAEKEAIDNSISGNYFLSVSKADQSIFFISDAHRKFVSEKLLNKKVKTEGLLIKFFESDPYRKSSVQCLPELYRKSNRYDALKNLINVDYVLRTLQNEHDLDLLIRNVRIITDVSYEQKDLETLSKNSIIGSFLNTLSMRAIGEGEIDALLSLNNHQEAIVCAYRAKLPEDRLKLLAKVCYDLKKKELPIHDGIMGDLEHLVYEIKPTPSSNDKLIEIAADLFHVNQNAASELVNKLVTKVDGKLIDIILAAISIKIEDEPDSIKMLQSMITNQSLRDMARVNSPIIAKLKSEEVITEVNKTSDVSAKLFLIRSWCNSNRNNPDALRVILLALDIMTQSNDYVPSMRHLRQICEPLKSCVGDLINKAIVKVDILKKTSINKPADEGIRLELLLAFIENKLNSDIGYSRFQEAYKGLESILDLDIRCYCLVRCLIAAVEIFPDNTDYHTQIKDRLDSEFSSLILGSADHYNITRRIIRATTIIDPQLAMCFASKLNTQDSRDKAYFDILSVYVDTKQEGLDFFFLDQVVANLSENEKKDWAIVIIIKKISQHNLSINYVNNKWISAINNFIDPSDKCVAYSFLAQIYLHSKLLIDAEKTLELLSQEWAKIDSKWAQVGLGYNLITILGKECAEFATNLLEKIRLILSETPLADPNFIELYINSIRLIIRTLPDILKNNEFSTQVEHLYEAIQLIPSSSMQTYLFAEIALQFQLTGKQLEFEEIVSKYILPCLDSIHDLEAKNKTIVKIAPALFLYERTLLERELANLSPSKKEQAFLRVRDFIISKRSADDPVDLDGITNELDSKSISQLCDVIKNLSYDWTITSSILLLINNIVKKEHRGNNESCRLPEKQALYIATELVNIVNKLPDKNNIRHEGYKIVCTAALVRLRGAVNNKQSLRANSTWASLLPSTVNLTNSIPTIQNTADIAYVYSIVAEHLYHLDMNLATTLLEKSRQEIYLINNINDRIDRLLILADSWRKVDDKQSSKIFLREALEASSLLSWESTRDEYTGKILELAHTLDPEFAASLTSTIDNPIAKESYQETLEAKNLQNRPNEIVSKERGFEILDYVDKAAYLLLRSFCSGRGYAQSKDVVCNWLRLGNKQDFEGSYNIYSWSIENNLAMNNRIRKPQLETLYEYLLEITVLIRNIGQILIDVEKNKVQLINSTSQVPSDFFLFPNDEQIKNRVETWIAESCGEYIKIYDAYFSINDLSVLKYINPSARVDIFTLWKSQKGVTVGAPEIEEKYRLRWKELSDQRPPETHIYIIGVKPSGDGPIHDRFIISDENGIAIGTSLSGLGNRDSTFRILSSEDVNEINNKFINPLLLGVNRIYHNEKISTYSFTL